MWGQWWQLCHVLCWDLAWMGHLLLRASAQVWLVSVWMRSVKLSGGQSVFSQLLVQVLLSLWMKHRPSKQVNPRSSQEVCFPVKTNGGRGSIPWLLQLCWGDSGKKVLERSVDNIEIKEVAYFIFKRRGKQKCCQVFKDWEIGFHLDLWGPGGCPVKALCLYKLIFYGSVILLFFFKLNISLWPKIFFPNVARF